MAKRSNQFLTKIRQFVCVVQAGTPMAMPEEAPFLSFVVEKG